MEKDARAFLTLAGGMVKESAGPARDCRLHGFVTCGTAGIASKVIPMYSSGTLDL